MVFSLALILAAAPVMPSVFSEPNSNNGIRQVDFMNFAYPNRSIYYRKLRRTIRLTNGEFQFHIPKKILWLVDLRAENIKYADITGDANEEAVIDLFSHSGASGGEHFIYVYTLQAQRPKLLWFLETYGSGTDIGGIKEIYGRDGDLTLELFGKNRVVGNRSDVSQTYECDRCYRYFTRIRFHWNGNTFYPKSRKFIALPSDN
jgi:hypothetical protein